MLIFFVSTALVFPVGCDQKVVPLVGMRVQAMILGGQAVEMLLDPMSDQSVLPTDSIGSSLSIVDGLEWTERSARTCNDSVGVLGMSPKSSFMAIHGIVTLNPTQAEMTIGELDTYHACKDGRMDFYYREPDSTAWVIPLNLYAGKFGTGEALYELGFVGNDFFVYPRISERIELLIRHRHRQFMELNESLTPATIRAELPRIHFTSNNLNIRLSANEYLLDNFRTLFRDSSVSNGPRLPSFILERLVVQLDAVNNRVGFCTPI